MLNATLPVSASRPASAANPAAQRIVLPQETKASEPLAPSKTIRIDASLPLVVTEFRSADGKIQTSIPTPREIDAYRKQPSETAEPALNLAE